MTQPTQRLRTLPARFVLDQKRGEVWLDNPWSIGQTDHNLSAYERNQVYLNLGDRGFVNVGALTSADSQGDGRGVLIADVNGDLQPDLIVRQSGGGPLVVYANRFPPRSRLEVSLEGTTSNRMGVGATVIAEIGQRRLARQLFPQNNFVTSQDCRVRFGLGDAQKVDRLVIRWPSGTVQEHREVPVGVHIRVREGAEEYTILKRRP